MRFLWKINHQLANPCPFSLKSTEARKNDVRKRPLACPLLDVYIILTMLLKAGWVMLLPARVLPGIQILQYPHSVRIRLLRPRLFQPLL